MVTKKEIKSFLLIILSILILLGLPIWLFFGYSIAIIKWLTSSKNFNQCKSKFIHIFEEGFI